EHTSELQSRRDLVCRLLLEKRSDVCSDRKSTRLNSSHVEISYAVFCLKSKKQTSYPFSRRNFVSRCVPGKSGERAKERGARAAGGRSSGSRPRFYGMFFSFFFKGTGPTEIYPLSLQDGFRF